MGIASRHRLLLILQRSVCRFKGASLHEFQVHVAVAGIGRKALGGAKILLDRGAAADGEAIVVGVGKGHATTACGQVLQSFYLYTLFFYNLLICTYIFFVFHCINDNLT